MHTKLTMAAIAIGGMIGAGLTHMPTATADHCDTVERCWTVEVDGVAFDVAQCAEEDGNVDGKLCVWVDPDTGTAYPVDSANYR